MQGISSTTVCNWFYFFFVVNLLVTLVAVGKIIYISVKARMLGSPMGILQLITVIAIMSISVTNSLFFYLMCDRGLTPGGARLSAASPDTSQGNSQANYVYRPSNY